MAVGLTQDLTLILSTKKHQTEQNKENKTQARIHLLLKKWRGIHCEEYMLCVTASNNILENANREEDMHMHISILSILQRDVVGIIRVSCF